VENKSNITPINSLRKNTKKKEKSNVSSLSPREIVSELDRYVIGQSETKKTITITLKNK